MNRLSRSTLLLAVTCASFALIGSQEAQADTAITDIECLTDESGETVACYQFFRLDFDGDDPDSRDWAFSKTAAEDQRCDTRTECFGGNGFLATIVDEDQNEFLRQMARDAQHAGNFPLNSNWGGTAMA